MEEVGGGIAGENIDAGNATASGFHFGTADDLIAGPVASFDKNVGEECGDKILRSEFGKDGDGIHAFQAGQNFGAFLLGNDGAVRAFELADAVIAVKADDENIAERAGGFEAADVAGMKKIEASIGKDDDATVAFLAGKPQDGLFLS